MSLNIINSITEIIILYNISNVKNTNTLFKFIIKIKNTIFV